MFTKYANDPKNVSQMNLDEEWTNTLKVFKPVYRYLNLLWTPIPRVSTGSSKV